MPHLSLAARDDLLIRLSLMLLLGLNILPTTEAQPLSPLWDHNEHWDNYVHFPDTPAAWKDWLEKESYTLRRSPILNVFTTIPEPPQRVYPLVKGMMLRNHLDNKILWAHPNYLITDGLEYGCREMVDGKEEHVPVESTLCDDHCLFQGRYCAPFEPSKMPDVLPTGFKGKDIVKEALRRLCFDHYYHASDIKWFEYLEAFERKQCLQQPDVTQCSMEVIEAGDHMEYDNLAACVNDTAWEMDIPNKSLEQQLSDAKSLKVTRDNTQFPLVRIGNVVHLPPTPDANYTTEGIFNQYCNSFQDRTMYPVSCDVCGKCQNVRHCLWTLECDGKSFDSVQFMKDNAGKNGIPEIEDQQPQTENDAAQEATTASAPETTNAAQQQEPSATTSAADLVEGPIKTLAPMQGAATDNAKETEGEEQYEEEEEEDEKSGVVMLIVIICVAGVVVGFIMYRDRRTKRIIAQIHQEQSKFSYGLISFQ